MIEILDIKDTRAVRNKNMILDHYDLMINNKKAEEGTRNFHPAYIQHNPLMADGRIPLAEYFSKVSEGRDNSRIVVHKIIAVGDFVWTHVNFLNFFSDDPNDTGVAGVDIFKMDADGRAIEHWDVLQFVGNPADSARFMGAGHPARQLERNVRGDHPRPRVGQHRHGAGRSASHPLIRRSLAANWRRSR